ncbi:hypothetical protein KR067_005575 [Drosophila pandora]|nr:hypothetical protein KR067_005575 [Drosophila pandora]
MLVLGKFCFFAIIAWNLIGFSTGSQDNMTSSDLKVPQKECYPYCLMLLKPITNHIALHQNEWADRDATKQDETQQKLNQIINKLEVIQDKFQILNDVLNEQNNTLISIDKRIFVLMNFERISSRYFYISKKNKESWIAASEKCKRMGGYLAVFLEKQEVIAINNFLTKDDKYWTGLNDIADEGILVSTASAATGNSKQALYTNFSNDTSNDLNKDCVSLVNQNMEYHKCDEELNYMCQLDQF